MKDIAGKIVVFTIALMMFAIAAIRLWQGFALTGRTSTQQKIQLSDNPTMFWMLFLIPLILGIIAFVWGLFLVFGKNRS